MKQKLLSMMLAMLSSLATWSADGSTFTKDIYVTSIANTSYRSFRITYKIISEADKTVEVRYIENINSGGNIQSDLLTEEVVYSSVTYRVIGIGGQRALNATLSTINIPNSYTYIGDYAFSNSSLTSVIIPNSVKTIGEYNQEIKSETNVEIIPVSA